MDDLADTLQRPQRIMIIGPPGSGKSYLAVKLAESLSLPAIHVDKIHWMSGWVERPMDERLALAKEIHTTEQWVFEGGLIPSWPERLERADILIWIDMPLWIRMFRVFQRTWSTLGEVRADMAEGCPERLSLSFYYYLIRTSRRTYGRNKGFFEDALKSKLRLTSRQEMARLLASLSMPSPAEAS